MLKTILNERLKLLGKTKANLADYAGEYPTQIGNLLKENTQAAIMPDKLDKCFEFLGIDLSVYHKRNELYWIAAEKLSGYKTEIVANWGKNIFVEKTGLSEIKCLPDPDIDEFADMYKSGLVDMECTFSVFKTNVIRCMKINQVSEKVTPKAVSNAHQAITKEMNLSEISEQIDMIAESNHKTAITISGIVATTAIAPILGFAASLLVNQFSKSHR